MHLLHMDQAKTWLSCKYIRCSTVPYWDLILYITCWVQSDKSTSTPLNQNTLWRALKRCILQIPTKVLLAHAVRVSKSLNQIYLTFYACKGYNSGITLSYRSQLCLILHVFPHRKPILKPTITPIASAKTRATITSSLSVLQNTITLKYEWMNELGGSGE